MVRACDTGAIPFSYRNGCRNCAHRYDHAHAKADTSAGAGDGCPMYFVNSWALGWSRCQWSWMKLRVWPVLYIIISYWYIIITYYYLTCYYLLWLFCYYTVNTLLLHQTLLCIVTFFVITLLLHHFYILLLHHYYLLLHFVLLHCYNLIITYYYIITYSYKIIIAHYYIIITSWLHYYYVIITSLFPIAKKSNNERIITYYGFSQEISLFKFSLLHCYYSLLRSLPIITYYQLGNLQMKHKFCVLPKFAVLYTGGSDGPTRDQVKVSFLFSF